MAKKKTNQELELERRRSLYSRSIEGVFVNSEHPLHRDVYDKEHIDAVYPIDPRTGLPFTDFGRLTDPHLSPAEREQVFNRIGTAPGQFLPADMSDEDIYALIPPRYFTYDAVDVQKWRTYLSENVLPEMDKKSLEDMADTADIPDKVDDNI